MQNALADSYAPLPSARPMDSRNALARLMFDAPQEMPVGGDLPARPARDVVTNRTPQYGTTMRDARDYALDPRSVGNQIVVNMATSAAMASNQAGANSVLNWVPGRDKQITIGPTFVDYRVSPDGRRLFIERIATSEEARGQGAARNALRQILQDADKHGANVSLIPEPQEMGISARRLRHFYRGEGFRSDRGLDTMTRAARASEGG
jgi:GNAT superfamily N-acetyltransferase